MKNQIFGLGVLILVLGFMTFMTQSAIGQDLDELPFKAEIEATDGAFTIKNTGEGSAASFEIENSSNRDPALQGETNGSGPGIRARSAGDGPAMDAVSFGSGPAGSFRIDESESQSPALRVSTNGKGPAASFEGNVVVNGNISVQRNSTRNNFYKVLAQNDQIKISASDTFAVPPLKTIDDPEKLTGESVPRFFFTDTMTFSGLEAELHTRSGLILISIEPIVDHPDGVLLSDDDGNQITNFFGPVMFTSGGGASGTELGIFRDDDYPVSYYSIDSVSDGQSFLALDFPGEGTHSYKLYHSLEEEEVLTIELYQVRLIEL